MGDVGVIYVKHFNTISNIISVIDDMTWRKDTTYNQNVIEEKKSTRKCKSSIELRNTKYEHTLQKHLTKRLFYNYSYRIGIRLFKNTESVVRVSQVTDFVNHTNKRRERKWMDLHWHPRSSSPHDQHRPLLSTCWLSFQRRVYFILSSHINEPRLASPTAAQLISRSC